MVRKQSKQPFYDLACLKCFIMVNFLGANAGTVVLSRLGTCVFRIWRLFFMNKHVLLALFRHVQIALVVTAIVTSNNRWDEYNGALFHTSEVTRVALAAVITLFDLLIVMQVRSYHCYMVGG